MNNTVTEVPWTFKTWLSKFVDVDLPIGDLAKDVSLDKNFPATEDYNTIYEYLKSKRVHNSILWSFDTTWKFYQETK